MATLFVMTVHGNPCMLHSDQSERSSLHKCCSLLQTSKLDESCKALFIDDLTLVLCLWAYYLEYPERRGSPSPRLWPSMVAVSGQEQKGTEGEAASALASLDLSFGGALGSGPKDKAHWSRTWRSFLLPFVHDVTGLLYTNHHLPLLQHELCHQMQAAGLAPTRKPPVPREQQPAALKTAEPSMQSPSYAKASTDDSSASAGLSYLLRPASRGDTVYKSVANALLSTDQQIKQEASSTEAPPAHDSSASGVDQVRTTRCLPCLACRTLFQPLTASEPLTAHGVPDCS
eukprot:1158229-Pelagomonas_calceolata.AAC.1